AGSATRVVVIKNRATTIVRNFIASRRLHAGRDLIREINLSLKGARHGENRFLVESPAHDLDSEGKVPAGEARGNGDRGKPGERGRDRKMSERYIVSGSSTFSPRRKAGVGIVGQTI